MDPAAPKARRTKIAIDPAAARLLATGEVARDIDRAGQPNFLVPVPDLDRARAAELGVEVERRDDGAVVLALLLYDIPSEPVGYDLAFDPAEPGDLRFLQAFLETAQFRVHPCSADGDGWRVGPAQTYRLPPSTLLHLKSFSLEWDRPADAPAAAPPPEPARPATSGPDPRDTVIRKLKEQAEALRAQVRERDKRIIELEDELHEIKSRGRTYRLSGDRRPWWKPFP